MWVSLRYAVKNLIRFKDSYESCDEGEEQKNCNVAFLNISVYRKNGLSISPAVHWSWRHAPPSINGLSTLEVNALTDAGFDCKSDEDGDYIQVIEKKYRHRWLAYGIEGWVISTTPRGDNLERLVGTADNPIATIEVSKEVALYGSLVQHWQMIRSGLPLAFSYQIDKCNDLLRLLYSEALLVVAHPNGLSGVSVSMGAVRIADSSSK